jgi:simple sugar transport system permease protein
VKRLLAHHGSLLATAAVAAALYAAGVLLYGGQGFLSPRVAAGFLSDNAVLGIVAVGMTFVIISGGIDLSVGAVVACSSILIARLIADASWHPVAAVILALALGAAFGGGMGALIHAFRLPPFIVTLAGMFFARGAALIISRESIAITHRFYDLALDVPARIAVFLGLPDRTAAIAGIHAPMTMWIFLAVLFAGMYIARWTRFGRNVYAVGGGETSALLMGLPVGRTKVGVYALSGLCAALGGAVHTLYTLSGNASTGVMLELDAIAGAVIGGTLLTGGVGSVLGTLLGVLIFAIIQTLVLFESLNSWWTRIALGGLLLVFILTQRALQRRS